MPVDTPITLGRHLTLTNLTVGGVARAKVPYFATNADALAAGLVAGDWYATDQVIVSQSFAVTGNDLILTETATATGRLVIQTVMEGA